MEIINAMNTKLRRRHRDSAIPSLRRCSTTSLVANHNNESESNIKPAAFFRFDSLQYASTEWRNAQMQTHNGNQDLSDKDDVTILSHFGSTVNFTSQYHYTQHELEPYRSIGDVEMDQLLEYLSTEKAGAFDDVIAHCEAEYNQYTLQQSTKFEVMTPPSRFYQHYHEVPPWVEWHQIQRGIDIFLAYLPAAGAALYYRSLIGGFSIPKIVEVLIRTRYLVPASMRRNNDMTSGADEPKANEGCSNDDRRRTLERLMDTGGFMACCFAPSPNQNNVPAAALRPGEKGWKSALQVRVLHAKVRKSLLQSTKWDMSNGVPINQEDMAATLLAFSVNVLLGIEYVSGKPLSLEDQRDYLALWRYLGWLLGVDTPEVVGSSNSTKGEKLAPIDPCGPSKHGLQSLEDPILHSYAGLESMILHLLHPTHESRQVVHHLLSFNGRVHFRSEMCRRYLGDPLSDSLGIAQCSSLTTRCAVYIFLVFLRCYTLLAMTVPRIRRILIGWHGGLQRRFLRAWEVNHTKRVQDAMGGGVELKKPCPFSMLMPPIDK